MIVLLSSNCYFDLRITGVLGVTGEQEVAASDGTLTIPICKAMDTKDTCRCYTMFGSSTTTLGERVMAERWLQSYVTTTRPT
jgi:hypothetical protein